MDHRPFIDDLDFLEHEVAWVEARCRHLAAVRDHEQDALPTTEHRRR
jgi:hypothetical protein